MPIYRIGETGQRVRAAGHKQAAKKVALEQLNFLGCAETLLTIKRADQTWVYKASIVNGPLQITRARNVGRQVATMGQQITIKGRTFSVEKTNQLQDGLPVYRLHGRRKHRRGPYRGQSIALYRTWRNISNPEIMFLVHERTQKIVFPSIRLTDRNGIIEVI